MRFLSPLWLIALLPWAAVVAWVLRARMKQKEVPFLQIWRGSDALPPPQHRRRPIKLPPLVIIASLAAMLLGIVAAAGPRAGRARNEAEAPVPTIIVDRGITMTGNTRQSRLKTVVEASRAAIEESLGSGRAVDLIFVPGGEPQRTTVNDWPAAALAAKASAVQTRPQLSGIVRQRLGENAGPVIIISDQLVEAPSTLRLVQIAPETPIVNAAISGIGVSSVVSGSAQVMVKVKNFTAAPGAPAKITVRSERLGESTAAIELPPAGQERNVFIDISPTKSAAAALEETQSAYKTIVDAELLVQPDDIDADNRAFTVEEREWPRVEARVPVGPELARMIEVYGHARKGGGGTSRTRVLPIVGDAAALAESGGGGAGIVLVASRDLQRSSGEVKVVDHPVTLGIDWKRLVRDIRTATRSPSDFNVVVSIGGLPAVAVREPPPEDPTGPRAVWVGFESQDLGKRADFVVFWARVFEWAAQAQQSFVARRLQALGPNWVLRTPPASAAPVENGMWPGIYRNAEAEVIALNTDAAPEVRLAKIADWKGQLKAIEQEETSGVDLRGIALLAACGLLLLAAAKWPRGWVE